MSSDERELRAALENTQAALRAEREAAKQLGQTAAELEARLGEAEQRERDLKTQLEAVPRPEPKLVYVSQPAPKPPEPPEPSEASPPWWLYLGGLGFLLVVVALKMLWEISDTPPWETAPSPERALPYGVAGALMLVVSIFGAVRAFRR